MASFRLNLASLRCRRQHVLLRIPRRFTTNSPNHQFAYSLKFTPTLPLAVFALAPLLLMNVLNDFGQNPLRKQSAVARLRQLALVAAKWLGVY
jgi:hypothetical protein